MALIFQFCLFPKGSDQHWSLLHGLEPIPSELSNFANCVEEQIVDIVFLEVSPDRFNWVKLRRIGQNIEEQTFQQAQPMAFSEIRQRLLRLMVASSPCCA